MGMLSHGDAALAIIHWSSSLAHIIAHTNNIVHVLYICFISSHNIFHCIILFSPLQGAVDNVSGCCDGNEQKYYDDYHHDPLEERVTIGSEYRSEWRLFWDGANISTMFVGDTGVQLTTLNKRK